MTRSSGRSYWERRITHEEAQIKSCPNWDFPDMINVIFKTRI
jgi:hypothetical protein